MSSSREEIEPIRAQRTRPTLRPPLPPTVSPSVLVGVGLPVARLAPSRNVPSSSRARRRTRDARMYPYASPLPPPLFPPPLSLSLAESLSRGKTSPAASDSAGSWAFSFARAGYRGQFVTRIRAGPFYKRNNYLAALPARLDSPRAESTRARLARRNSRNDLYNRIRRRAIYLSTA